MLTAELLARISGQIGEPLNAVQRLDGETGAVRARLGRQHVVVKASAEHPSWARHVPRILEALRADGCPVPRELHRGHLGQLTYVVKQFLPGKPPSTLPAPAWASLQRTHQAQQGLAARLHIPHPTSWSECVHASVDPHGPWAARWQALALSSAGAAFVDGVRARLSTMTVPVLPEDDVVHGDLHHGNLLVTAEQLTGVVDWDEARPGDCRADLVTLLLSTASRDPALANLLLPLVRGELNAELRWLYAARDIVRFVGWFALHHPDWDIPSWLETLAPVLDDLN